MSLKDRAAECNIHPLGGDKLRFELANGYALSFINSPMVHAYPFAWEGAVFGLDGKLTYETPLTNDVEVFSTDEEAEAWLDRAIAWAADPSRRLDAQVSG